MTPPGPRTAELHAELVAVVIRATGDGLHVLAQGDPAHLPSGPLRTDHDSLQAGVRAFAADQTGHRLGFVEQLYTFADLGRADRDDRLVSISYLGLTRHVGQPENWRAVYDLLPWEDHRDPAAVALTAALVADLRAWADQDAARAEERRTRVGHLFGTGTHAWRPELALQRYEVLWEAGLVREAHRHASTPGPAPMGAATGPALVQDHRRILATAVSRLRSKLQYSPVVVELMPAEFTLGQLQDVVESIVGHMVHKQNFRRAVHQADLTEPLDKRSHTGGRPAQVHRFRREVIEERRQVGTKVPIHRPR